MVKSLLLVILMFLAISGLCELIYTLKMMFYYPSLRVKNFALIILEQDCAVRQLNFIWQKIKWHGDAFAVGVIAIVDKIDDKEIIKCNGFINDKNIILCSAINLKNCSVLQGELTNGNR